MKNTRKLINNSLVEELEFPVTLTVYTKCPGKYKLIDLETGEEYVGQDPRYNNYHWKKLNAGY